MSRIFTAAQEALAAIHQVHKAFGAPGDYGYETKEGKALNVLYNSTRSLAPAINERGWIPVTESLPDSDITVMVFRPAAVDPVWIGYHEGEIWCGIDGLPLPYSTPVTHWMPFPDPPVQEG